MEHGPNDIRGYRTHIVVNVRLKDFLICAVELTELKAYYCYLLLCPRGDKLAAMLCCYIRVQKQELGHIFRLQ